MSITTLVYKFLLKVFTPEFEYVISLNSTEQPCHEFPPKGFYFALIYMAYPKLTFSARTNTFQYTKYLPLLIHYRVRRTSRMLFK